MSKINLKLFLLSLVVLIFLINTAYAARQALEFSDVDVKVGSKTSKNLRTGETIDDEAEPGDTVEFRVEVKNNYTSAEDLDIDDISVKVTIEEIDDGDDLEEESSDFDLKAGRDKRVTLKFQVPLEVDEDTFDVLIEAEGDDENGTDQRVEMRLGLEVDKETHLLKITRASLSPTEVSCNRKNVQLGATVINIGNEDEEDVTVQVVNSDLGIDLKEDVGELTAEPNEPESKFSKTYSFNIPNDAEAGSYQITLKALYEDGRKTAEDRPTLTVSDCLTAKQEKSNEEEAEEEVEVITPTISGTSTTGRTTAPVVQPTNQANTTLTQESFFKSNAFIAGIIIAEVVAVIVGIVLVVSLFRRKG